MATSPYPISKHLFLYQGDNWEQDFAHAYTAASITAYGFAVSRSAGFPPVYSVNSSFDPSRFTNANNLLTVNLPASETAHLPAGVYYYDVEVTASGATVTIYRGSFTIEGQAFIGEGGGITAEMTGVITITSFEQSLGSELLTNGNFETGDPPTSWSGLNSPTLTAVSDERTGGAGTKSLSIASTGVSTEARATQTRTPQQHKIIQYSGWFRNVDASGGARMSSITVAATEIHHSGGGVPYEAPRHLSTSWARGYWLQQDGTSAAVRLAAVTSTSGQSARFDDVSAKIVTLNRHRTIPADADIQVWFELPTTPGLQEAVNLFFRSPSRLDSAPLDCWHAQLYYHATNLTWYALLKRYVAGTSIIIFERRSIGNPTALRIKAAGDLVQLFTKQGSDDWIPRTARIQSSHNQTDRGMNSLTTEGISLTKIEVRPAQPFDYGLAGSNPFLLVGDSKTANVQWYHVFQHLIEQETGQAWPLWADFAVGGWTMLQMATNIETQLSAVVSTTSTRPAFAFINAGANDAVAMPATWRDNLRATINEILAKAPNCRIGVMRPWITDQTANSVTLGAWVAEVVAEYPGKCFLGPDEKIFLEAGDGGATFMADTKHPNTAGYVETGRQWVATAKALLAGG